MKYLIILLSFTSFALVNPGDVIHAKKINESISHIGELKFSLLTVKEFQDLYGSCWIRLRGQDISTSDLSSHTSTRDSLVNIDDENASPLSSLPNTSGRFFRDSGGNAAGLGVLQ